MKRKEVTQIKSIWDRKFSDIQKETTILPAYTTEDRKEIALFYLAQAYISGTRVAIQSMYFDPEKEEVTIVWEDGCKSKVEASCDSANDMIYDVVKYIQERFND